MIAVPDQVLCWADVVGAASEVRAAALVAVSDWRPDYVGVVAPTIPAMPWEAS